MNRELKFRVWDGVDYMSYPFTLHDLIPRKIEFVTDAPVMQYTGLKDKNGNEIYEGDILELVNNEGKTIRVTCEFGNFDRELRNFMGDINTCQITGFAFLIHNRYPTFPIVKNYAGKNDLEIMEVIGNIYQNPELLK